MPSNVLTVIIFVSVSLICLSLLRPAESALEARLRLYGRGRPEENLSASFVQRLILPVFSQLARLVWRMSPKLIEEATRERLIQAGGVERLDVNTFLGIKAGLMVGLPLLPILTVAVTGSSFDLRQIVAGVALGFAGWRMPDLWLTRRISARRKAIERALPDALDLIVVTVEAGHGLEGALATVTQKVNNPLTEEFDRALQEISLGKSRREALHALSQRAGVPDLQSFIAAILQAEQLGIGIGQVLRVQSEAMRVRRRQRAEETAAKVPVKMLMPLVVFIFPSLILVVLGPTVMRLVTFFHSGTGMP